MEPRFGIADSGGVRADDTLIGLPGVGALNARLEAQPLPACRRPPATPVPTPTAPEVPISRARAGGFVQPDV